MTFTTPQPRFQSFFGGRFFSQNWHFGITKRITKHNFLVLQSTYLYFVSNEDHTFEKKNVSFLLVTSTLTDVVERQIEGFPHDVMRGIPRSADKNKTLLPGADPHQFASMHVH